MRKSARRKRKKETFGKWRMAARHAQGPEELAKGGGEWQINSVAQKNDKRHNKAHRFGKRTQKNGATGWANVIQQRTRNGKMRPLKHICISIFGAKQAQPQTSERRAVRECHKIPEPRNPKKPRNSNRNRKIQKRRNGRPTMASTHKYLKLL